MSLFESAVDKHGLPWHVRVDQGFENVVVGRYMFCASSGRSKEKKFYSGQILSKSKN